MFNFKELKFNKRVDPFDPQRLDPFVGIRRSEIHNGFEFRLPAGFEKFPEGDFELTKKVFFRMYRSFKKFEQDNLSHLEQSKTQGKDNIQVGGNACRFKDREDNEVILYSKIYVIEMMLEAYQDLALNVIERTIQRDEQIDFSKIDRYLHKAIYLDDGSDNHTIYIDSMDLARRTLQHKSASLIELFCFILSELQQELEQTVDERVNELSNKFREQHLTYEQSLFREDSFEATVIRLKEILDEIDKITAYKDDDYWQLYEAIEAFLYGELDMKNTHDDGMFWGINNFWSVWEDMCHTYAFKTFDDIVYADTRVMINGKSVANKTFGGYRVFCKPDFNNPFFVEFRGDKRWMRPDLIRLEQNSIRLENIIDITPKDYADHATMGRLTRIQLKLLDKKHIKFYDTLIIKLNKCTHSGMKIEPLREPYKHRLLYPADLFNEKLGIMRVILNKSSNYLYKIVDWKYFDCHLVTRNNERIQESVIKQLSYELALQSCPNSEKNLRIESQFVIPFFYSDDHYFKDGNPIGDFMEDSDLASCLKNNGIEVFKANFFEIQRCYLQP